MDKEKALKEIQSNIKAGNTLLASRQISAMADHFSNDPFTLLTCVSLLKVIEDEGAARVLAVTISENVRDEDRIEIAKGLRAAGFPEEAAKTLLNAAECEASVRETMRARFDMMDFRGAIESYGRLAEPTLEDTEIMIGALAALNEYDRAVKAARELLAEAPGVLSVQRCYCATLSAAGMFKEAERFVKDNLKKNRSSSDANALMSCHLWIDGKTAGAGAYASKAIREDPGNIIAMEILAYCLVEKGKIKEAKIVAGAINEKEPGDPAVFKILNMCRVLG